MAVKKESSLSASLQRLRDTDLSSYIPMARSVLPVILDDILKSLDERQRSVVDKVLPVGGKKKIYLQLVDTPTPPIVIEMAQPLKISTMSEKEVKRQRIRGVRLTIDDIQLLAKGRSLGNMLKLSWRLKRQMFTILRIFWMVRPLLRLRATISKDMGNQLTAKYKPLLDLSAETKSETTDQGDMLKILMDDTRSYVEAMKIIMPETAPVLEMRAKNFEDYYRAKETGQKVAWINFATPPELFYAMDIVPFVYDGLAFQAAASGFALKYIDIAEQYVPDHLCSDNKIHLGLALSGDIPPADLLIYPSSPCDSNRTILSAMAEYCNIPSFCLDLPYYKDERALQYLTDEWKRLVSFLEEVTGKKLDVDKLRQVMEYSNIAHEYCLKLDEFRKLAPCPFTSLDMYMDGGVLIQFAGTPELVDYYKVRYDLTKERMAKKEGTGAEEKFRVVWAYGVYVPDIGVFSWLEEKYGAVSINCMNFNWVVKPTEDLSTYDSMLRGLAEKTTLMPMNREVHGPMENFIDATVDLCKRYKADCAIVTGHVACKSNWAVMKLMKDKIEEECGIPMLVFEVDLFDTRLISVDGVKGKLEEFFETIVIPKNAGR
ncbi:2-hydroxyacyl-CoA dehydratase subunit D [Chloroflexota bacterium]